MPLHPEKQVHKSCAQTLKPPAVKGSFLQVQQIHLGQCLHEYFWCHPQYCAFFCISARLCWKLTCNTTGTMQLHLQTSYHTFPWSTAGIDLTIYHEATVSFSTLSGTDDACTCPEEELNPSSSRNDYGIGSMQASTKKL